MKDITRNELYVADWSNIESRVLAWIALAVLSGCAEPPTCSPGMSVYHCVPAPFPDNARIDQGWLHERAIPGCPGAVYVAPDGELQQCP